MQNQKKAYKKLVLLSSVVLAMHYSTAVTKVEAADDSLSEELSKIEEIEQKLLDNDIESEVQQSSDLDNKDMDNLKGDDHYLEEETIEEVEETESIITAAPLNDQVEVSYRVGDIDEEIRQMKLNLFNLGYGDEDSVHWTNPDSYFGLGTEEALKEFQSDAEVPVNGVYDFNTKAILKDALNGPASEVVVAKVENVYSLGDSHEEIQTLKSNLLQLGYGDASSVHWTNPDTYFGKGTESELIAFQMNNNLPATGKLDSLTSAKIDMVLDTSHKPTVVSGENYSVGQTHEAIRALKRDLLTLGYGDRDSIHWTNPDAYFGAGTEQALKAFQRDYNLKVTGIFDSTSGEKINHLLSSAYSQGQSYEEIRQLKKYLLLLGYGDANSTHWTNPDTYFGKGTEEALIAFQKDFQLPANGRLDQGSWDKMIQILNTAYYVGKNDAGIIQLKEDLLRLGYGNANSIHWTKPDGYFGTGTKSEIKKFQKDFDLPISGVYDSQTSERMNDILNSAYFVGKKHEDVRLLKTNLMLMGYGDKNSVHWTNPDNYFGAGTKTALENFQREFGLSVTGILDAKTAERIDLVKSHQLTKYNMTLEEALDMQMRVNPQTDRPYAYISSEYVDEEGIVTADVMNVRSGPGILNSVIGTLEAGTEVTILSEHDGWYRISTKGGKWVNAVRNDVSYYLNPTNFLNNDLQLFQFLDLSRPSGATAAELNNFLRGKGILHGMGQSFIAASRIHGVNEVYLIAHALLETAHGASDLATGIIVEGKTVYNMFGIGAYDKAPELLGSQRAYEEEWFTPEDAIIGGAKFIGENYISVGQNTLYSMRWNPNSMHSNGYATHQYATDIGWASKQVYSMYNLYRDIGINRLYYDIPVFKN